MTGIESVADTAMKLVQDAIGMNSPGDQIVAAIVLGGFIIITSSIGLVGTLLLTPLAFAMAAVGILRLVPQIDALYPL